MLKKNGPLEEGKWFYYLRQKKKKQNKLTLFTSTDLRAKCKEQWSMAFGLRYRYCRLLRWNQIGLIACTFRRFSIWNMGATNRSFLAACLKLLSEKKNFNISQMFNQNAVYMSKLKTFQWHLKKIRTFDLLYHWESNYSGKLKEV